MNRVSIFKTNVRNEKQAREVKAYLLPLLTFCKINFDLEDRDKILRVEGTPTHNEIIEEVLDLLGYSCIELE